MPFLSFLASVVNPCGWVSPILIPLKIIQAKILEADTNKCDNQVGPTLSKGFIDNLR